MNNLLPHLGWNGREEYAELIQLNPINLYRLVVLLHEYLLSPLGWYGEKHADLISEGMSIIAIDFFILCLYYVLHYHC